jgi:cyclohexyl-isocyanide hydratase
MAEENGTFIIGIPIYQGVDLLDVAAPFEIFNWMGEKWTDARQVKVYLIAETHVALLTRDGLQLVPHKTFDEVDELDLLWVPGGDPVVLAKMMQDRIYLDFLRTRSECATYVTSVCEGALLLASAGLLDGYEATTHWAFLPCLRKFHEIIIAEGYPRFVVSDKRDTGGGLRVTGGGVSSGLDEALELVRLIGGDDLAKQVQLVIQYYPKPPVDGEIPPWDTCPVPPLK